MSYQIVARHSIHSLPERLEHVWKRLREALSPQKAQKSEPPSETIIRKCKFIPRILLNKSRVRKSSWVVIGNNCGVRF